MSTAIATRISSEQLSIIQTTAVECRGALELLKTTPDALETSLGIASAIRALQTALNAQIMAEIAALQGSALGFKADKKYSPDELRGPIVEALVRGFRLVGNEMNVIAGNFYGAQAGFERMVKEFPGLTDLNIAYDVMEVVGGVAKVQCIAVFRLRGSPEKWVRQKQNTDAGMFDDRIPVRVNSGMGHEAIIGKARRKFNAWIFDRLTGAVYPTPKGDLDDNDEPRPQEMVPMFSGGPVKEEAPKADDGCPLIVAEYRAKFAGVSERPEIGKVMAMAGRDSRLTPNARKEVAALANEAQKLWPKKLDAGEAPMDPPFNPPTDAEIAAAEASEKASEKTTETPARQPGDDSDLERDARVGDYVERMKQAGERKDGKELAATAKAFAANPLINYHAASMATLKAAKAVAMRAIQS